MFPGVNGFHWTIGHLLFLGIFFSVVLTILATVTMAAAGAVRDFRARRAPAMCWKLDFAELPAPERHCRHELAGRVDERLCPNAFDCRGCTEYEQFAALAAPSCPGTFGLHYPDDRFYDRGHTWLRREADGTFTVGLDDMAERLVGTPDWVELPPTGERVDFRGPAWRMKKDGHQIRVRAPLDGVVVATGGPADGWYLRVRPEGEPNLRHLLRGAEVRGWLGRELERLQLQLAPGTAPALADGGILASGLVEAMPQADWDTTLAATFLE